VGKTLANPASKHLYEAVLGTNWDKRNFRKNVLGLGLLAPRQETLMAGRHRPAQLFRFNAESILNYEPTPHHHAPHFQVPRTH